MDNKIRSAAKTISWRIVATVMTFGISYFWLDDFASSFVLAIVANFLKTIVYYAHERGWNTLKWGRTHIGESRLRSVGKSTSWRLAATLVTFGVSYFWFSDIKDSASFVGVAMTVKFGFYYLHERGWNALGWGHAHQPQDQMNHAYGGAPTQVIALRSNGDAREPTNIHATP